MRALIPCFLILSACLPINPVTAIRLATTNPLEADPGDFAVQVTLPDGIGVTPGTAELALSVETPDGPGIDATYPLTQDSSGAWRLQGDALDRMRADQVTAMRLEDADPDGTSGSFGAGFTPCTHGAGPDADARTSISLQITSGGDFLPLLNDAMIHELYPADLVSALQPCRS